MSASVKGALFVDYVRMLRARKTVDWSEYLHPEDLEFLRERIDVDAWYPMATFERMGLAILAVIAGGKMDLVRHWGRASFAPLAATSEHLLVPGNPRESLMRFQVVRASFFDFDAVLVRELFDRQARLEIDYGMGPRAEEAASYQALGFFEELVTAAGGKNVAADFSARRWAGDPKTLLVLAWSPPG